MTCCTALPVAVSCHLQVIFESSPNWGGANLLKSKLQVLHEEDTSLSVTWWRRRCRQGGDFISLAGALFQLLSPSRIAPEICNWSVPWFGDVWAGASRKAGAFLCLVVNSHVVIVRTSKRVQAHLIHKMLQLYGIREPLQKYAAARACFFWGLAHQGSPFSDKPHAVTVSCGF